ncbi:MAG: glycosyl hydrolase 53 family protein [Psychroflexus sp.]|nr:glycosyl hydrolase 53 family protein [Psychroflexus sp.]
MRLYYKLMLLRFLACILFLQLIFLQSCKSDEPLLDNNDPQPSVDFIKAMDMSLLPEIRQSNAIVKNHNGEEEDMLITAANHGMNTIRLRLWKNPLSNTSGFTKVRALSDEIHSLGLNVLLSVHYSDTWADPGHQHTPALWQNADYETLKDSVFNYTKRIINNIKPDFIQIGNEINSGFLHPLGHINQLNQMKGLLEEGIRAVRDTNEQTKIILHFAGHENANSFFSQLDALDFDIIGLSYYPRWHGRSLSDLDTSIDRLETNYDKKVLLVETAYPFTLEWYDQTNNIIGSENQILSQFEPTPQGQKSYFSQIKSIMKASEDRIGFISWGSEWIAFKGETATDGSPYENQAFWDFNHQALPVFQVFE